MAANPFTIFFYAGEGDCLDFQPHRLKLCCAFLCFRFDHSHIVVAWVHSLFFKRGWAGIFKIGSLNLAITKVSSLAIMYLGVLCECIKNIISNILFSINYFKYDDHQDFGMEMKDEDGIYGKNETITKKYTKVLEKYKKSGRFNSDDTRLIKSFLTEVSAHRQVTPQRKYTIITSLAKIRDFMPPFRKCTTEDIFNAIERYRDSTKNKKSTQGLTLTIFKQFLMWMIDSEHNTRLISAKIAKIKNNIKPDLKTEHDILTGSELEAIYNAAKNLRDRTFFEILYDSGGRVNEICLLKWSQISFKGKEITIRVMSKTNKERLIPLYTSKTALKNWMSENPGWDSGDSYVFFGRRKNKNKPLSYFSASRIVHEAARNAGITKNVTPHTFRHTRITDLMRAGVPEQAIKVVMWGSVTTDMLRVYTHLTPTDAVNSLNATFGIHLDSGEDKRAHPLTTPLSCSRCFEINSADNRFCLMCGNPLTREVTDRYNTITKDLESDPIYQKALQAALDAVNCQHGS